MSRPVVPAIIPASLTEARALIPTLGFSPELHLDLVDGAAVPASAWPIKPKGELTEIKDLTDCFTLEVDLMVMKPLAWLTQCLAAGADMIVLHVEGVTLAEWKQVVALLPGNVSLIAAANNDTPLQTLETYLTAADGVQLMGIAKIGAQGQPFDERVLERIMNIKSRWSHLPVTVDGSVNQATIPRLVAAGVDRLVVGSAIVEAANRLAAYDKLTALAN